MKTEKDSEVQVQTNRMSMADKEKYRKCYQIYRLGKEICRRTNATIRFICTDK